MPTSSVDILNKNDVINDVVIITQGMWSTQYMSQLQHIEQFFTARAMLALQALY